MITEETYPQALHALTTASQAMLALANAIDIPAMRSICGKFEALAPVLEPTAYMRGGMDNLHDQAAFLTAVDRFVTDLRKLDRREPADA